MEPAALAADKHQGDTSDQATLACEATLIDHLAVIRLDQHCRQQADENLPVPKVAHFPSAGILDLAAPFELLFAQPFPPQSEGE
jgi:hypothetical protein